ncbi:uncharacterized protein LOC129600202 [Paramacrobiotus metropolitanus]|uniref:uncharacterized protein LOC129600202 n=1 Tax=Paramacrobiotus metropolitanus TaxID=2943436 RepID=UPI0024455ED7|nr:uncharacterized protein LOC129600202 [Paramacrobiotus metropolitanus]
MSRHTFSLAEKITVVEFAKLTSIHKAATTYNVDRKSVRSWIKQEEILRVSVDQGGQSNRKRLNGAGRKPKKLTERTDKSGKFSTPASNGASESNTKGSTAKSTSRAVQKRGRIRDLLAQEEELNTALASATVSWQQDGDQDHLRSWVTAAWNLMKVSMQIGENRMETEISGLRKDLSDVKAKIKGLETKLTGIEALLAAVVQHLSLPQTQ